MLFRGISCSVFFAKISAFSLGCSRRGAKIQEMKFTLWNVQHGISVWIRTPSGQHHWIDLGKRTDFSPTEYVGNCGVRGVDFLIISHPDKDHIEDLPNFVRFFGRLKALLINKSLPPGEFSGSGEAEYQKIMSKFHSRYTSPVSRVQSPRNPKINGGIKYCVRKLDHGFFGDGTKLIGNDTSVVVFILYQGVLFVCPGDIEPKGWNALWSKYDSDFLSMIEQSEIRFLIAPHHGRKSGYSKEMMNVIKPNMFLLVTNGVVGKRIRLTMNGLRGFGWGMIVKSASQQKLEGIFRVRYEQMALVR